MRFLTCTAIAIFTFTAATTGLRAQGLDEAQTETVRIGYELTLTRCKAKDCHTDSAAKGETDIVLKPQGTDGASGTQVLQEHADGVSYTTTLKAWNHPQGRGIDITLTGQSDLAAGTSASFHAHQRAVCVAWNTLPVTTLTADPYMEDGEQVTPALHLKVIPE